MVIKNLVIENANLQNCNVFIQGGIDTAKTKQVALDLMASIPKSGGNNTKNN